MRVSGDGEKGDGKKRGRKGEGREKEGTKTRERRGKGGAELVLPRCWTTVFASPLLPRSTVHSTT